MRGSALPHREWKASAPEDADEGLCRDVRGGAADALLARRADRVAPGERFDAGIFYFIFAMLQSKQRLIRKRTEPEHIK